MTMWWDLLDPDNDTSYVSFGVDNAKALKMHTSLNGTDKSGYGNYKNYYVSGTNQAGDNASVGSLNGTINGVIVEGGGHAGVAGRKGLLINGTANSGGSLEAIGSAIVSRAYVTASAAVFAGAVTAGKNYSYGSGVAGTALDPHVAYHGIALTGGGENNFTVKGYTANGSGGLISGGTFDAGSFYFIGRGGQGMDGQIAGRQFVLSNGTSINQLFSGGSATQITNGGISKNATAITGATLFVSGGQGTSLSAYNGGTIMVGSGQYVTYLTEGYQPHSGGITAGTSIYDTVTAGGTEVVSAGGTSLSASILRGGRGTVLSGGLASALTVSSGATEIVSSGGMVSSFTVNGGTGIVSSGATILASIAQNSGGITISSGGYGGLVTVQNAGTLIIDGGTTYNANIGGGTGYIIHNGTAMLNTVSNGGTLLISSGTAVGNNTNWGIAAAVQVNNGTALLLKGAVVSSGIYIRNDGLALVSSGGTADNIQANGGTAITLKGGVLNTLYTTGNGTGLVTDSGASVTYALAGSNMYGQTQGGTIFLSNGGTANYAGAAYDGTLILGNGGVINSTFTINGGTGTILDGYGVGGSIIVSGGQDSGYLYVAPNQEISPTVSAANGGTVSVDSAAKLDNLYTGPDGTALISSGAGVLNYTISGGTNSITSGVVVTNLSVIDGGTGIIASRGTVINMSLANGYGTVASGATVANLIISSGASGVLMPGASVFSLQVNSGGWVSGAQVNSNSEMTVLSGGTAVDTSVMAYNGDINGQDTVAYSGATMSHATIIGQVNAPGSTQLLSSGGLLTVESGANLYNTSMGFNARLRVLNLQYNSNNNVTYQGGVLTVKEGDQTWSMTLTGDYHGKNAADTTGGFVLTSDDSGNTVITYTQCFLTGSMIRTPKGDVAVEKLRKGDQICTYVDDQEIIKTLTSVVQRRAKVNPNIPEDLAGWSVIISKGAFSENVPSQDLSVTPEHCFYFQGRFIPARMLINGKTIRYDHSQEEYDYYHVETEQHSIIWANDALTESWLNTHDTAELLPEGTDTARLIERQKLNWNTNAAAPLDVSHEFVKPIYDQLLERAHQITQLENARAKGDSITTHDPAPYLRLENGQVITPLRQQENRYIFSIPALTHKVKIGSRLFRPSEAVGPYLDDRRQLGILVGVVSLWHGTEETLITRHIVDTTLSGWDVIEQGPHRWTNAEAELPLHEKHELSSKAEILSLEVLAGGPYSIS